LTAAPVALARLWVRVAQPQLTRVVRLRVVKSHGCAAGQHAKANAERMAALRSAARQQAAWARQAGGRAGVRRGARLTSVPADRRSSPARRSRGRDRRRLNIAVRLRVVKPTVARQGRKANRQPWHNGSAQVAVTRTAGRRGSRRGAGRLGGFPGGVAAPVCAVGPA
jgi:hypothetical protein